MFDFDVVTGSVPWLREPGDGERGPERNASALSAEIGVPEQGKASGPANPEKR